jgi:orotate phosphoribosyltransferase
MAVAKHSDELAEFYARALESSPAEGRHVELASGRRATWYFQGGFVTVDPVLYEKAIAADLPAAAG